MATEVLAFPRLVGRWFLNATSHVGRVAMLVADLVRSMNEVRIWLPRMFTEAWNIGVGSLFIVLLISGFAGGVTALQARYQFTGTIPVYYLAGVIVESIVLELGPVLTGLILAGRIGARYAAELGTMRVTEQIDALSALGTNPIHYLVVPRLLACFLLIPLLTLMADFMGVIGGAVVSTQMLGVDPYAYWQHSRDFVGGLDLFAGVFKSYFFGAAIALISCHRGFHSKAGAEGVGRAATEAFVFSFIAILFLDFCIGLAWNTVYNALWPDSANLV